MTNPTPTQQGQTPPDRIWMRAEVLASAELREHFVKLNNNDIEYVRAAVAGPRGDESGWLLEKMHEGNVHYVCADNVLQWTDDPNKALRLARRDDAEALATIVEDCEKIASHEWVPPAATSPQPPKAADVLTIIETERDRLKAEFAGLIVPSRLASKIDAELEALTNLSAKIRAASLQPPSPQSEEIASGFTEYLPLAPVRIAPGEYEVKARDGRTLWRMDGAALADWVCASVNGYDAAIAALNPDAQSVTAADDLAREIVDVIWGEAKKLAQSFVDANVRNYNDHKGVESLEKVYDAKRDTAQQIVNQMHNFNEARWRKPKDITSRIASALTAAQSRQREVDAKIAESMRPSGGRMWTDEQTACFEALTACAANIRG